MTTTATNQMKLDDGSFRPGYVGYCHDAGQAIHVGDIVCAVDEWGYWAKDIAASVGTIEHHHGWHTTIVRADGHRFIADGHTTRLTLMA